MKRKFDENGFGECLDCKIRKHFSEFPLTSKKEGRYKARCKPCNNKLLIKIWGKYSRKTFYSREFYRNAQRKFRMKNVFGFSDEEYQRIFASQNGCCAICEKPSEEKQRLCVDHDHKTKKIRGLLCHQCNLALGNFCDNLVTMRAAINYLERAQLLLIDPICIEKILSYRSMSQPQIQ